MLRTILSTFVLVFMAEIGDKTQLAAFGLAAEANAPWAVFIGAGAALLLSTALAWRSNVTADSGRSNSRSPLHGWLPIHHRRRMDDLESLGYSHANQGRSSHSFNLSSSG